MESRQGAIGRGWGWVEKVRNLVFGRNLKLFKCILFGNQFSHSLSRGDMVVKAAAGRLSYRGVYSPDVSE